MLERERPLVVNYIMGVAAVPAGFDRVAAIEPGADRHSITLRAASGRKAEAKVDLDFLCQ